MSRNMLGAWWSSRPWDNHVFSCDGGAWGIIHTYLKHVVKEFYVAVAADAGGSVTTVVIETNDQLSQQRPAW